MEFLVRFLHFRELIVDSRFYIYGFPVNPAQEGQEVPREDFQGIDDVTDDVVSTSSCTFSYKKLYHCFAADLWLFMI